MLDAALKIGLVVYIPALFLYIINNYKEIYNKLSDDKGVAIAWMFMFLGSGLWFERHDSVRGLASLDQSALVQVGSVLLAGFIVLFKLASQSSYTIPVIVRFFIAYGVVCIISTIVSPAPTLSLYKSCLVLLDSMLVIMALRSVKNSGDIYRLIDLTAFLFTVFLIGAMIGGINRPDLAVRDIGGALGYNLNGIYPIMNANELGYIAGICSMFGLTRMMRTAGIVSKYYWASLFLCGLIVLFFSQSRTSIVGLMVALLLYFFCIKHYRKYFIILLGAGFVALIYFTVNMDVMLDAAEQYLRRGQDDQQIESMSGRVGLWLNGLYMWSDSFLIGHGFEAGVKYGGLPWGVPIGIHMHNAHLQVLINTGVLGYLTWIVFVLILATRIYTAMLRKHWGGKDEFSKIHIEISAILIITLLRTFTGSVLVFHQASLMLFMAILVYSYSKYADYSANNEDKVKSNVPAQNVSKRILRYKK